MKKVCFFTIADDRNLVYAKKMLNSLRKFHPDIPHHLFGQDELDKIEDPQKFYRMYAQFGERLSKDYELVINIDADSIVCGDLNHIINDEGYEAGAVLNNNLIDKPLTVWNVAEAYYVNCGFLAARSQRFWRWWNKLNFDYFFPTYQYREQDMLNIIFTYGDLKTKIFDFSDKWHGLISKGAWHKFVVRNDEIILPETEGICEEDKIIKIIHWAGGSDVPKMNFHVSFSPEVVKKLEELTT